MSTQNHEVWNNGSTPMFLTNPTTSVTLSPTTGTGSVVLTNSNGTFLVNGQPSGDVSTWSVYPATSNTIKMDSTHNLTSSGNNLYFNGSLIANASDIQNIGDWALYNAISDVKLSNLGSNYSITGAKNITAISNVSAGSVTSSGAVSGTTGTFTTQVVTPTLISASNLSVSATSALTQYCGTTLSNNAPAISNSFVNTYSILGDKGSDYTDFCYTTLSNKGGKGGQINLVADAGSVTISGTTYGIGGLVNITANSPLTLPYNATSAIKLSAASILSYAGAVTPLGSLAGYNYIQGTLGVNIVAGSASSIPNTAGTIYLYGANGTKLQNGLYLDTLANYPGSNLNIHPDSAVDMTKVQFIGMGSATNESKSYPVIRGNGSSALYDFSSVSASNALLPALVTYNISNAAIPGFGVSDITITASSNSSSSTKYNVNLVSSSNINLSAACNVVVNDVNFTTSGSGWAAGSNHTLYGDVPGGSKYIRWSYNNNPGTLITDNNSITVSAGTGDLTLNTGSGNFNASGAGAGHYASFNNGRAVLQFDNTENANISSPSNINLTAPTITLNGAVFTTNATSWTNGTVHTLYGDVAGGAHYIKWSYDNNPGTLIADYASIFLSAPTISLGTPTSYTSNINAYVAGGFNIYGAVGISNGNLYMNNNSITQLSNIYSAGDFNIYAPSGLGIGLNNNTYFNNFALGDVGAINMKSAGTINANGSTIYNVANMTGSNLTISTGGNLTLTPTGTTNFSTDINLSQHIISNVGGLTRTLNSTPIAQPVIQYGTATGSGTSGTAVVTLSPAYAASNSYVVQVTMRDSPTAQLYATPTASNSFTIGWSSAGTGTQNIMWTTFGT